MNLRKDIWHRLGDQVRVQLNYSHMPNLLTHPMRVVVCNGLINQLVEEFVKEEAY